MPHHFGLVSNLKQKQWLSWAELDSVPTAPIFEKTRVRFLPPLSMGQVKTHLFHIVQLRFAESLGLAVPLPLSPLQH